MHAYIKSLAALIVCSPLMALAVDEHHPDQPPAAPMANTTTPATPMQDKAMNEQMQKMQAAHDKMLAAKTPAERQAAMQEAMSTMKNSMGMMHDQCPGMGMGMGKGMSGSKEGHGTAMMDMMMKMMDQQSSMMKMPMGQ
ncbi:hypothetical protein FHW68_000770 [Pseudomonas sp. Tn43]|uniref:hypothetical protein n=1 Tax=unclassified Pseudomonas TaxID=196821 RepID=UPI000BAB6CCC|nr:MULTISPECIES: hypothetical protein [unclassified Pseudomonas]MBB3239298.1 hypothetical protein [Pseudomonas sp. Tn43]PAU57355.1 hypothetical protein BZL43_15105 [Pseudomonas sp. PICF141]